MGVSIWRRDARRSSGELELGRQLLGAARIGVASFTSAFDAAFLGHRPDVLVNVNAIFWGITAIMLRGRKAPADEDLISWAATSSDSTMFDRPRLVEWLVTMRPRQMPLPKPASGVAELYSECVCCNTAIDARMRSTVMFNGSWQKSYDIASRVLRARVRLHDQQCRR